MSNKYDYSKLKIFSLSSNRPLAQEVVNNMGMDLGKSTVKTFADGEFQINMEESVRGCDVFVIQSTSDPVNQHIMELLVMIDALKRASVKSINVIIPYYGYARQDRKARAREPITAKLIADLIEKSGADRVIAVDLHAPQIQGFFDIPVDQLTGIPVLSKYFKDKEFDDIVVVAPDHGSVKRARQMADRLKAPIAIIDKRGSQENNKEEIDVVGDIEGKIAIVIDDIVDTGNRITRGTNALIENGAKEVYACCTHAVLSGVAMEKIQNSQLKEVVVTNTIPLTAEKQIEKITQLTIAPLISEAIIRIYEEKSISELIDE